MKKSSFRVLSPTPCLLAVFLAARALGQAPEGSRENPELTFARALVDRGWTIVAEGVIERGLQSSSPADRERFRILRAQLHLRAAQAVGGSQARAEAFKKAFTLLDELVPPGGKPSSEGPAAFELGEFLIQGCSLLAAEARRENEAARAGELKKRALRMIETAEKIFQARLEAARGAASAGTGGEEDEEAAAGASREEMDAAYSLARVRYERGMATDGKTEREAALKAAIRELDDFQVSYEATPLAYEAAILSGNAWNELGEFRRALSAFDGAANLTELFKNERGKVQVDNPYAADVIQRALYLKAQAANRSQKGLEAQAAVKRALELFPEIRRRPIGYALRIEGAHAFARQGNFREASRVAQEVVREDPDGPGGSAARQALTEFLGKGDLGIEGGTEAAIIGLLERGDVPGAIRVSRQVLTRLDRKSGDKAAPVLLLLGKAYSQAERHREAAILFEELLARHPAHRLAPEAAFQGMRSRLLANAKAPSRLDQERYERNLKTLTEKYKDSPQAPAGQFLKGEEAMDAGKFEEASRLFLGVPENAGQYRDTAMYMAGLAVWNFALRAPFKEQKAIYQRAEKLLRNCLQVSTREEPGLDPERIANRKKLRVASRLTLAGIHSSDALKEYPKALELLETIEREDEPGPDQAALLYQSRVRTMAALGRIDDAVQSYRALREKHPAARTLPGLSWDLALAYDGQAVKARAAGGSKAEEEYRDLSRKALEFYAGWVEESRRLRLPIRPQTAVRTADRALAIALEISGLPEGKDSFSDALSRRDLPRAEWERAAMLLEEARPKKRGAEGTDWRPLVKLGRAYGFLGDWPKARAALEEALVWGGLLAATGEAMPTARFEALEKAPELLEVYIDLGFTELIPGRKVAMPRAQAIFDQAFGVFGPGDRETCSWWKCRYGYIASGFKDGKYEVADAQMRIIQQAFPEWDKDQCGVKQQFDVLKKELETKLQVTQRK